MDYSHPTFYHMRIKGPLPKVLVPGKRVRLNVGLVNELESFRGEDIYNECPIPLRVVAIPLEDENANPRHDMEVEIVNRHIRVKPLLFRGGTGTLVINIRVAPLPLPLEGIPFLLQVTVSNKCRIFHQIIPACSEPLLMVPVESPIAMKMFEEENEQYEDEFDEDEYEDYEDYEHEDMEEDYLVDEETFYNKTSFGVGDDEDEDEEIFFEDEDEDFDIYEDDEEAKFSDDDLYEVPMTEAQWREAQEHNHDGDGLDSEDDEPAGNYHAFVADSLANAKPSPILLKELHVDGASAAPPVKVDSGNTIAILGAKPRRALVLPQALLNKRKQQTDEENTRNSSKPAAPVIPRPGSDFVVGHRDTGAGMTIMNAPGITLLDPVTGSFDMTTIKTSTTLAMRNAQKDMSCAYIKEITGNELGCRIWDGAIFLIRFFHRLLQQSQNWTDGLRVLELGAGTGVAGIYLWHMIAQRVNAQVAYARKQGDVTKESLCDAFALLSFRDHESLHDNQRRVTQALNTYGMKSPLVAVTDMEPITSLLRTNAKLNQTSRHEMFSMKNNPLMKHHSPTGLHVFDLAWGTDLSRAILKLCGVSIETGHSKSFSNPAKDSFIAAECFTDLRKSITGYYNAYRSLRRSKEVSPIKPLLGLDMVFASECLYNDRHFSVLIDSIKKLYISHAFGHAQMADAITRGELAEEDAPPKVFPLILLSYRIRAIEEEETIINAFFRPLEEMGIYHTSIPVDRVLCGNEDRRISHVSRPVHDTVHQRWIERVEREKDIPNILGDLEQVRLKTTRFAVMYQCPNKWMPASSCDPALYEKHTGEVPPSPLPFLSPNATTFFKLFQTL